MNPRLLDLFCGAGGCSVGYARAGFDVTGLDVRPQPRYPFAFVRGDALRPPFDLRDFDVIHASPPCQRYSTATRWRGDPLAHPDLIAATRALLVASGRPWVIENVEQAGAAMSGHVLLCGSMFGLRVRRHRLFELSSGFVLVPDCRHRPDDHCFDHGGKQPESVYRDAMGCGWMTVGESRQAIPPAYTEWLGKRLLRAPEGTP